MVQHFENFAFSPGSPLFIPAGEFFLVHDFRREGASFGGLELGEVDGADVSAAEALDESEVGEGEDTGGGFGSGAADAVPAGVTGGSVRLGGGGDETAGGCGCPGGLGAGTGAAVDVGDGGGGVEAHAFQVVRRVLLPWLHGRDLGA